MSVRILRQYNGQNGAPTIDTTGGGKVWVVHCGTASADWWGTIKLNGAAGDHSAQLEDVRHSTMVAIWFNPPIGSSIGMSNEYNTNSDNTTWVIDGGMDYEYQVKYYAQEPDTTTTTKPMSSGCLFTVARTGRSGYSCYPYQGETIDYDINFRTYPAWIGHKYNSNISGSYYSSSGNNYDKLQTYFIVGRSGMGVMMWLKQWTEKMHELIQQGAIPLGKRPEFIPI